ncbi:MAG: response regulator [Acidimicrobiia bacterium]
MEGSIRVIVADDHVFVRAGIETLIADEDGFEVAGSCGTYDELLDCVAAADPHVVLTDIRMPPTRTDEGIRAAVALRATHPHLGVVVLSQYLEAGYALELIEAGSAGRGYLLKDNVADPSALFSAIRAVAEGRSYIDPAVVDAMFAAKAAAERSPLGRLTGREGQILAELATGKTNAAIAAALGVGERAVEKHINSIFLKLDLTGDVDAHRRVKAVLLFLSER